MTAILTAVAIDRHTLRLGFDGLIAAVVPEMWRFVITPNTTTNPTPVEAVSGEYVGTAALLDLQVETGMSPGEDYSLSLDDVPDALGANVTGGPIVFTTPSDLVEERAEWSHGLLRAMTRAFAEEIQYLRGRLATITTADFSPGTEEHLYVESTLGWPLAAALFVDGKRFRYKDVNDSGRRFMWLKGDQVWEDSIAAGAEVVLDVAAILTD